MVQFEGVHLPLFKKAKISNMSFEGNQNSEKSVLPEGVQIKPALKKDEVSFSGPLTGDR